MCGPLKNPESNEVDRNRREAGGGGTSGGLRGGGGGDGSEGGKGLEEGINVLLSVLVGVEDGLGRDGEERLGKVGHSHDLNGVRKRVGRGRYLRLLEIGRGVVTGNGAVKGHDANPDRRHSEDGREDALNRLDQSEKEGGGEDGTTTAP